VTPQGHSRSSEPTRIDPPPMIFYERTVPTMVLFSYHFRGNGDFSWKSIFPPRLFNAPAEEITCHWVSARLWTIS